MLEDGKLDFSPGSNVKLSVVPTFEIYYQNGFGIYNCLIDSQIPIVIKGMFPLPLHIDQVYEIEGKVVSHKFEKQIQVNRYRAVEPRGAYKVIAYLTQLKGLNTRAEKIYEKFGDDSIRMLKENPEKVAAAIKGISERMAKEWQNELLNKETEEQDLLFLLDLGLSVKQAKELQNNYQSQIRSKLNEDPYILLSVRGSNVSFSKCDQIAKQIGIDFGHPSRIEQGIRHALQEATREGHTFLPKEELFNRAKAILDIKMTPTEMKKVLEKGSDTVKLHARTFKVDLKDIERRLMKMETLKRDSAKERYRYPIFELESNLFERALDSLEIAGTIVIRHNLYVALRWMNETEKRIAEHVWRLAQKSDWPVKVNLEKTLDTYLDKHGIELEEKQREAVLTFASKRGGFYILNGSAGCGKTFTLKIILAMLKLVFKANNERFVVKIMAPTGKASKVATNATGYEAETIHRGLEYHPEIGFQRNWRNPLPCNVLVVDESSMMDVELAAALFEAVETGTSVILIGDTKQLPSVGAGNVLRDLIDSGVADVVTLDVVKRQSALSGIIKNANHVIRGKMMKTYTDSKDAFIIHEENDETIQKKSLSSIQRLLNLGYSMNDIQVLVPQKRGTVGVYELNKVIQSIFNPRPDSKLKNSHSSKVPLYFRVGDKVIHIKNDYDKIWYRKSEDDYVPLNQFGITNGETGIIEAIDTMVVAEDGRLQKKHRIVVRYDSGYIFYLQGQDLNALDHAYALSIHKSQGSQWPAIIISLSRQHSFFLDRNLIYTAWTRAEKMGIILGPPKVLALAIRKVTSTKRWTQLREYLREMAREKPLVI